MPGYGGGAWPVFLWSSFDPFFGKLGTAILILSIPMIDAFYTLLRRVYQKKSPFRATGDTFITDFWKLAGEKDELRFFTGRLL
jgi:hypothetical protein